MVREQDFEDNIEFSEEESDLFEHYRFQADKGQSVLRIDKFLANRIENASRNKIQNAARAGNILANNNPVKPNYKVKPGDLITVLLPHPPREIEIIPQDIPLDIVFEDQDVTIVNKKAGMVVHPAYGNYTGTLVNALTYHFLQTAKKKEDVPTPMLVHRIDKDTSGLLIIAKNELSQSILAKQFFDHSIERKYMALVWGDFAEDEGTITGHIGRSHKDRKVMSVFPGGEYGKHAITHYKVIERFRYVTLAECRLETGRTHQIRAHMKFAGHPIFNDSTYGGDKILKGTTYSKYSQFVQNCFDMIPRQALHAASLGFRHPASQQELYFESPLPNDFDQVLTKWRKYTGEKA